MKTVFTDNTRIFSNSLIYFFLYTSIYRVIPGYYYSRSGYKRTPLLCKTDETITDRECVNCLNKCWAKTASCNEQVDFPTEHSSSDHETMSISLLAAWYKVGLNSMSRLSSQ